MFTTLISASQLQALENSDTPYMVFDCSFELMQPERGNALYLESHIAGAVHADLDHALSARHGALGLAGAVLAAESDEPASGGRHPLPSRERFATWLCSVGFTNAMQAVVYDRNGTNFCGRLWWMLQWAGHDAVAVLDGGWQAWLDAGGAVASGTEPAHFQSYFELAPPLRQLATTNDVRAALEAGGQTLIDARAAPRYLGQVEPLDRAAGHIPGALNRPFSDNLDADGRFKPADALRREFDALLQGRPAQEVVHYCGSGASALPNLLAMEIAGLGSTALYAGSWSEWSSDPSRPVERG